MLPFLVLLGFAAFACGEKIGIGAHSSGSLYVVNDATLQWVEPEIPEGVIYRIFVDSKQARLLELAPELHPVQEREYLTEIPTITAEQNGKVIYAKSPERLDSSDTISIVDAAGKAVMSIRLGAEVDAMSKGAPLTSPPKKIDYTQFYDVTTGYIRAKTQRSLYIPKFSFTTRSGAFPPDAYITVKTDGSRVYHQGFIRGYDTVGNVAKTPKPIKKGVFDGQNITVDLPEGITVKDIRYVGVWCEAFSVEFGAIQVSKAEAEAAHNSEKLTEFVPPVINVEAEVELSVEI